MLKRLQANAAAKKTSIFIAAFVVSGILMSSLYAQAPGMAAVPAMAVIPYGQAAFADPFIRAVQAAVVEIDYPPAADSGLVEEAVILTPVPAIEPQSPEPERYYSGTPNAEGFVYCEDIPLSKTLQQYTWDRCVQMKLDYSLVIALMWRESRFNTDAVGMNVNGTQDSGIMQINDVNKGWLSEKHGITNLMDPVQNIDAGTLMLSGFAGKYGEHGALMAYQYGESGMKQKIAQGVTTNKQIEQLMEKRAYFHGLIYG